MRSRTQPLANRLHASNSNEVGAVPMKLRWILAGAVLMALVFGIEPAAANAATSPADARTASLPGLHLTSARANHGANAPASRPARRSPAHRSPGRAHPGNAPAGHRTLTRLNRHPHGRWNGHSAGATLTNDLHQVNSTTHVETAWLRAPRQRFTPAPETRGPPRASPSLRNRPHTSPAPTSERTTRLGRAPSPSTSTPVSQSPPRASIPSFPSATTPSIHRVRPFRRPHARRFEGPAARKSRPSGEISS